MSIMQRLKHVYSQANAALAMCIMPKQADVKPKPLFVNLAKSIARRMAQFAAIAKVHVMVTNVITPSVILSSNVKTDQAALRAAASIVFVSPEISAVRPSIAGRMHTFLKTAVNPTASKIAVHMAIPVM